ncbi:unnamed protein product [marine sediment metagenome]|uniref:Uncharacterized protein n=1 Tax=marine sediment metagenome TaxID=412755 RepID=X1T7V0_9ZZZZ
MTSFMTRSAKHFFVIKAARQIRQEIEKAGLETLKTLANAGTSIVGTYLQGCSAPEKAKYRRDLNTLLSMGITADMVLGEVTRQMPEIATIMESKQDYKKTEIQAIERFLKEG